MAFDDETFSWQVSGKVIDIYPLTVEEYENAVEELPADVEVE
jgi:hypothetical protein